MGRAESRRLAGGGSRDTRLMGLLRELLDRLDERAAPPWGRAALRLTALTYER